MEYSRISSWDRTAQGWNLLQEKRALSLLARIYKRSRSDWKIVSRKGTRVSNDEEIYENESFTFFRHSECNHWVPRKTEPGAVLHRRGARAGEKSPKTRLGDAKSRCGKRPNFFHLQLQHRLELFDIASKLYRRFQTPEIVL